MAMTFLDWNLMKADGFDRIVAEIDAEVASGARLSDKETAAREQLIELAKRYRIIAAREKVAQEKAAQERAAREEAITSEDVLQMIRDEAHISSNEGLGHFEEGDFTEPRDGEMILTVGRRKWKIRCEVVS